MTTVALVGATGFVGRLAFDALNSSGVRVIPIRAPRVTRSAPFSAKDLGDEYPEIIATLAESFVGVDIVINAAGDPDASSRDVARLFGANAVLPGLIGLACRRAEVRRFVHISSAAVQGRRPTLDDSPETEPFSDYSRSKAIGETAALTAAPTITTVYRPPSVHGPDRRVTRTLTRLASGPLSSAVGDGRPTPQALGENVGSAIAFLATTALTPPTVVAHPSEGLSTRSLLTLLGGRQPRTIPESLARLALGVANPVQRIAPSIRANVRRVEMVWFGQGQAESWLTSAGWRAPIGHEGWVSLGRRVRQDLSKESSTTRGRHTHDRPPAILFGVTTGLVVESFFSGQFKLLHQQGWDVTLVSTDEGQAQSLADRENARFIKISAARVPTPTTDAGTFLHLIRILRQQRPDIAVWGTPKLGLLGPLASRLTRVQNTYVLHGLRLETTTGAARAVFSLLERIAMMAANDVIAVSHDLRREAIEQRLVSPKKIHVLGAGSANGVEFNEPRTGARDRLKLPKNKTIVAFVGRITQDKGIHELLKSWATVHNETGAILVLAGMREPDAYQEPLRALLETTPGLVELGHLDDLGDIYSATDVLALPTYREGLGTVVLEAASYSIPAVVSDATGVRDSVVPDMTGLTCTVGDVESLTLALLRLVNDEHLRLEMGRSARENVKKFERSIVHDFWLTYFNQRRIGGDA